MLLIHCPHCGPRDECEFQAGGEGCRTRPAEPMSLSDAEWADFLFMRRNERGVQVERWHHVVGCRRWFTVLRDSVSHEQLGEAVGGNDARKRAAQ